MFILSLSFTTLGTVHILSYTQGLGFIDGSNSEIVRIVEGNVISLIFWATFWSPVRLRIIER